jgi:hypothetical protein
MHTITIDAHDSTSNTCSPNEVGEIQFEPPKGQVPLLASQDQACASQQLFSVFEEADMQARAVCTSTHTPDVPSKCG